MPFLHDLLALKRPSRKWGPGGNWVGCKMACFGWNTHPSAQGSSTLTPLSPQDSPLDPLRGVSSCEGPGGQTWKNTCKARARLRVSPRPPERDTRRARGAEAPPLALLLPNAAAGGGTWHSRDTRECSRCLWAARSSADGGGSAADFSTLICKIRLRTTSQRLAKWKGFSSLNIK